MFTNEQSLANLAVGTHFDVCANEFTARVRRDLMGYRIGNLHLKTWEGTKEWLLNEFAAYGMRAEFESFLSERH